MLGLSNPVCTSGSAASVCYSDSAHALQHCNDQTGLRKYESYQASHGNEQRVSLVEQEAR